MNKVIGIYKIENTQNGKVYIGQSINIHQRWHKHRWKLENKKHDNKHLQNAWDKYGETAFVFSILEECKRTELNDREKIYIDKYKSCERDFGYNITSGGKCEPLTAEHIENLRRSHLGNKLTPHTKEIAIANLRKPKSKETCEKISKSRMSDKNPMAKSVVCVETEIIYPSASDASRITGICRANISQVCRGSGRLKTAGGYHWEFI